MSMKWIKWIDGAGIEREAIVTTEQEDCYDVSFRDRSDFRVNKKFVTKIIEKEVDFQ